MSSSLSSRKRTRMNFGQHDVVTAMPNLIEIQKNSYDRSFLQLDIPSGDRVNKGLHAVLNSIFPIEDSNQEATIEYLRYHFDSPKYDVNECKHRGLSYSAPLKVTMRLIVWDVDKDTGVREIKGIKEQDVYMGDMPMMTKSGTFVINGTERVVVSQMHRSPGVFFDHDSGKTHASGKYIYSARVIPYRGSWLDLEFDARDFIFFRIDRKRKLYVTTLLMALGLSKEDIFNFYYDVENYSKAKKGWVTDFVVENVVSQKLLDDLVDADTGEIVLSAGQKITPRIAKKLEKEGLKNILLPDTSLLGKYVSHDMLTDDGELLISAGEVLTEEVISQFPKSIKKITFLSIDSSTGPYIRNTLFMDKVTSKELALIEIYKVLRPGEIPTVEAAQSLFDSLFFDESRYDLSEVGRLKLNARLDVQEGLSLSVLTKNDIINIVRILVELKDGKGSVDDIDHLANRRVRSVGELIENQFRVGLVRMERAILERLSSVDVDSIMPNDLVNSKLLVSVIREFFGMSQLSQFMDQTNPLSEVTHKRRLSALGPGGLSRERAGFEVRDVHPTHYGRICPIETPEGQNIGLINSMATFSSINKYGFIESPYRKVKDGKITKEVVYLSAIEEGKYKVAQANSVVDEEGNFTEHLLNCRFNGDFVMTPPKEVDFADVAPMQVVSVAASLIPFLEHDDANRALMGSNMQRQAVPLLTSQAPLVGTGIEAIVSQDSGSSVVAINSGIVEQVDSTRVVIKANGANSSAGVDIYTLSKFQRSNHNTCINQKPLVQVGDLVDEGDIIADGSSSDGGEIALGKNVLVAFLSWSGCNFEDSILISSRIVKGDVFTSIHIEEFELVARDTRLGPEEITRDIPNLNEENLNHLDEVGIVHIGAHVKPGDIMVGKVTPKSESPMTPEEKLLRAIFGEKAADVRDSSLHVPRGVYGTIVDVRVLSRRGIEKDSRALAMEREQIQKLAKDRDDELAIIENFVYSRLVDLLRGQVIASAPKIAKEGDVIDQPLLSSCSRGQLWQITVEDSDVMSELEQIKKYYDEKKLSIDKLFDNKVEKVQAGDDLPQGALKIVKVFVAVKHKLQPGDKMAGRHGNKGVISRIIPEEDMPFLEDGTIIDVVLNPLGLPSRMNVGQVLETHLGWAGVNLGHKISGMLSDHSNSKLDISEIRDFALKIYNKGEVSSRISKMSNSELLEFCSKLKNGVHFATPVFDGAGVEGVKRMLDLSGVASSGQAKLIDGRTGEYFDREVTIGYKYLLKLHHLVDDKIHARSIGPYSLVTQQPLGGKSHGGGQRFGEMECWALQAYGAAYTLQEILTVKSDDVVGRVKIYESIIRGNNNFESGIPESFNVMIKEFRSLCLNIELENALADDE